MATQMTKRQIMQMRQKVQSEIDWDLLEELDLEEEGQAVPMQDPPSSPSQEASSQEEPIRQTIPSEAVLQKFLKSED